MHIRLTAKSWLTSGVALSATAAMAFAPVVVQQAHDTPIGISITAPAIELAASVDPQNLIATLQGAVDTAVNGAASLAMLPADGFVKATTAAQSGATSIYDALIAATSNPTLQALLTGLKTTQTTNLGYLVNTAQALADTTDIWLNDSGAGLATNVENALNTAIELTLTAVAGVINDPLELSTWAALLSSAVYSTLWGAGDLTWAGYAAVSLPLSLLQLGYGGGYAPDYSGFAEWIAASIANWSQLSGSVVTNLAAQTGSPAVESLAKALVAVTSTPLSFLARGFADASSWAPVFTAIVAPWSVAWAATNLVASLFYNAGDSIGGAIGAIGAGPLDPANYINALQGFVTAGFNVGSDAVWSINAIGQSLPQILNSLNYAGGFATNAVVNAVANSVSGLLAAVGAAPGVVAAPIDAADTITGLVSQGTVAVNAFTMTVGNAIEQAAQRIVNANIAVADQINTWLGDLVPGAASGAGAVRKAAAATADSAEIDAAASQTGQPAAAGAGSHRSAPVGHPVPSAARSAKSGASHTSEHGSAATTKSSAKPKGVAGSKRARAGAA